MKHLFHYRKYITKHMFLSIAFLIILEVTNYLVDSLPISVHRMGFRHLRQYRCDARIRPQARFECRSEKGSVFSFRFPPFNCSETGKPMLLACVFFIWPPRGGIPVSHWQPAKSRSLASLANVCCHFGYVHHTLPCTELRAPQSW